MGDGTIYDGGAGCGKTYRLCQKALAADDPIILSFTNKAIQNVKLVLCDVYNNYELAKKCYTFDLFFCDHHGRDITALEGKTMFVDEYSMTPNKWMTKLYQAFTKYRLTIYMFGDTNQCDPVEPTDMFYDYFTSIPISEMCPRWVEMKYIEEYARYDQQTRDLLTKFLKSGTIKHQFQPPKDSYHNIWYLNKTRRHVTQECCNRFTENLEYYEIDFKYQGHRGKYKVAVGMPMLVTQNMRNKDMFNMEQYNIDSIGESEDGNLIFTLNDTTLSHSEFRESFIPAFCVTVYKYQGGTISTPYNIYDVENMDKKQLYTALSRTTELNHVHLETIKLNPKYKIRMPPRTVIVNSYFNDDYHNGQIYKITFEHNINLYIGSSIRNLQERLNEHVTTKSSAIYQYKGDNPVITPIIRAPCKDDQELNRVEAEYIRYSGVKYGDRLLHKQLVPKQTVKIEYKRQAQIETENQIRERLPQKFGDKIKIKDDPMNKLLYYDVKIDGKRYATKARYNEQSKEEALTKITKNQQQLIDELTIEFN